MRTLKTCVFLSLLLASSAGATPMPLDGTWVKLDQLMNVGAFFADAYVWTSPLNVRFTITDYAALSDQFEVYDNATLVLTTPAMPDWDDLGGLTAGAFYQADPDLALAGGLFSSGEIVFGPGAHSITIRDIHIPPSAIGAGPFPDGSVAFKAVEVIPAPGAILLGGIGASIVTWMRRRRTL